MSSVRRNLEEQITAFMEEKKKQQVIFSLHITAWKLRVSQDIEALRTLVKIPSSDATFRCLDLEGDVKCSPGTEIRKECYNDAAARQNLVDFVLSPNVASAQSLESAELRFTISFIVRLTLTKITSALLIDFFKTLSPKSSTYSARFDIKLDRGSETSLVYSMNNQPLILHFLEHILPSDRFVDVCSGKSASFTQESDLILFIGNGLTK